MQLTHAAPFSPHASDAQGSERTSAPDSSRNTRSRRRCTFRPSTAGPRRTRDSFRAGSQHVQLSALSAAHGARARRRGQCRRSRSSTWCRRFPRSSPWRTTPWCRHTSRRRTPGPPRTVRHRRTDTGRPRSCRRGCRCTQSRSRRRLRSCSRAWSSCSGRKSPRSRPIGYSHRKVGLHYLELAIVVVLIGAGLGLPIGVWLGGRMTDSYQIFFHFPDLQFQINPRILTLAAASSLVAALAGALANVRAVMRLPPAEAMRPRPSQLPARVQRAAADLVAVRPRGQHGVARA